MRGEFKAGSGELQVHGLNTPTVSVISRHSFRIGPDGNMVNRLLTNRDAPWIQLTIEMQIHAGMPVNVGDVHASTEPGYPCVTKYLAPNVLANPHLVQYEYSSPSLFTWTFISVGDKWHTKGKRGL